ncbi:hypothetical protein [Nocardia sp. NPDC057227]
MHEGDHSTDRFWHHPEMAHTHPADYQTLTRQPGFIAYRTGDDR